MSRPGAALARALDRSAAAERARRAAPQLDIVASHPAAEASLPAVAVEAGPPPGAGAGGTGTPPTSTTGPALPYASRLQHGRVALEFIDVAADRLRPRDADWEQVIAATYTAVGQLQPIRLVREATGRFTLDGFGFGVSRLEAARLNGWAAVEAEWCDRGDVDQRFYRLPEIFEAIARRRLTALDECRFMAEYKAIHLQLFPAAANGGDPKKKQALKRQNAMIAFWEVASDATGLSRRSVEIKVAIWDGLAVEARDTLSGTRLADNQAALKALAVLAYGLQLKVIGLLLEGAAATVADAIVLARGQKPAGADDRRFRSVAGGLTRLSAAARRPLWSLYADEIIGVLRDEGLI